MGDGRIFLKTSAPLFIINVYKKNLIYAESISLDSTFNMIILKPEEDPLHDKALHVRRF
jgi:hypothetical protein